MTRTLILAVLLTLCGTHAGNARPRLLGTWVVAESACAGCQPGRGSDTGTRIVIGPTRIVNPLGTNCSGAVTMTEGAHSTWEAIFKRYALPPAWRSHTADPEAIQSKLFCNGSIAGRFISLSPDELLMPYEAETVLRLHRVAP